MKRYIFHIVLACALGFCKSEPEDTGVDPQQTKCICKPIMRLEWEPSASLCNNETFDWLIQTMLGQVSKQKEDLTVAHSEVDILKQQMEEKEAYILSMEDKLTARSTELSELERQNSELTQKLEDIRSHKAHSVSPALSELERQNSELTQKLEDVRLHKAHLKPRPHDCADVMRYGFHYSGIYTIYPPTLEQGLEVFCDLNTDDGGWLVFQRRQDGSEDFAKLWEDYKWGFGKLAKEFWLGNENIHTLTGLRNYEMRVDMTDYLGKRYYATYGRFTVDNESNNYSLHVADYFGDAGDAMIHHNNAPFSTSDKDNDKSRSGNCSELYGGGGWWYVRCYDSNLNGIYSDRHLYETVVWYQLRQNHEPMRHVEMKIRPKGFK